LETDHIWLNNQFNYEKMKKLTKPVILILFFLSGSFRLLGQEKTEDFISLLKQSGPYDRQQNKAYPAFAYQPSGDPHLGGPGSYRLKKYRVANNNIY
jgi:hypothetical protein